MARITERLLDFCLNGRTGGRYGIIRGLLFRFSIFLIFVFHAALSFGSSPSIPAYQFWAKVKWNNWGINASQTACFGGRCEIEGKMYAQELGREEGDWAFNAKFIPDSRTFEAPAYAIKKVEGFLY